MPDVIMPKMGDAMEEGKVVRWLKSPGDEVEKGETIAEIETDKAVVELEAPESGVLQQIIVQEDQTVPVGTTIAAISEVGELAGMKGGSAPVAPPRESAPQAEETEEREDIPSRPPVAEEAPIPPQTDLKASPIARRIAEDAGIDMESVTGTGPGGRIVEADMREYLAGEEKPEAPFPPIQTAEMPPAAVPRPEPEHGALSQERLQIGKVWQVVARRMTESKQHAPHFYVTIEADMEVAIALRNSLNASRPEDHHISLNDLVVKACAVALQQHPTLNASYIDESHIEVYGEINIGIAVALSDGLIAPVIRRCESKSLTEIADESRELIRRTRDGSITPNDYEGGTFTISNLGMYGVDEFVAILNPPQAAILAVGAAAPKPVVVDDRVEVRNRMRMTASGDHRVTDGARVAEFLRDLKQLIEQPFALLE